MSVQPTVLLVEEDSFTAELIAEKLAGQFLVKHIGEVDLALAALQQAEPSVVLLNLSNPAISGFKFCQQLRGMSTSVAELPVIFLTEQTTQAELMQSFELGGNDYMLSATPAIDFCSRIKRTLAHCAERNRLKADLTNAYTIAMTAMSSASEVGEVLQFLKASFGCKSYLELCKEVLITMQSFNLEARVQIRGHQAMVAYSPTGPCTMLEESVFETMAQQGRLISFSTHTSCSFEHITLIVKNMPREDLDRYGRLSDSIALLCEVANERVIALDSEINVMQEKLKFEKLVDVVNEVMVDMNEQLVDNIKEGLLEIHRRYNAQTEQLLSIPQLAGEPLRVIQSIFDQYGLTAQFTSLLQQIDYRTTEVDAAT